MKNKKIAPKRRSSKRREIQARLIPVKERSIYYTDMIPPNLVYPIDNQTQANRDRLRKLCRYLYSYHWLVGGVVDLYAEFPVTGLDCFSSDKNVEDYFKKFLRDVRIQKLIAGAGKEYWRLGEAFIGGEWDEEAQEFSTLFLIPPEMVELQRKDILEKPTIYMKITDELRSLIQNRRPYEKFEQLQKYYPEIVEAVMSGKDKYEVSPESKFRIWHWKHEANDYDDYGHPFITRAFRQIVLEEKVFRGLESTNDWWQSPILHVKIKTDPNTLAPPSKEQMAELENLIFQLIQSEQRVLVTDETVELSFINMERPQSLLIAQLDKFTERMLTALGINRAIIQGEAVTYSGASIATDFLIQRFEAYRQDVVDFLDSVASKICEARGWTEKPNWVFGIMDFRDKNAIREFLIRLKQMGVPISNQTLLDYGFLDYQSELNKIREEEKLANEKGTEETPQKKVENPENIELPEESREVSPRAHERS